VSTLSPGRYESTGPDAAGIATGFWSSLEDTVQNWQVDKRWEPRWSEEQREEAYAGWKKAVERTFNWVEVGE
jgi:glycerol kinase